MFQLDSQTQSQLVPLDLSILVDITVTQQNGSQLVQLRTRDIRLERKEGESTSSSLTNVVTFLSLYSVSGICLYYRLISV